MKSSDILASSPAPNLMIAIRVGFDAIANHIFLVLFPVVLDSFLWLGPRMRLTELIHSTTEPLMGYYRVQNPGMDDLLNSVGELWGAFAEQFNLLIALRTYPVGIPSLMVSRMPAGVPFGDPSSLEITSIPALLGVLLLISLVGLIVGTLYFVLVSQVALDGEVRWREAFDRWPKASLSMIYLALLLVGVLILASIPGSFIISLVALGGLSYGQCALLVYSGFVLWLILPFVFSPHGIVVNRDNIITAVKVSTNLLRRTLPTTILFLLVIFLLSKGLDILWLIPADTSWLLLIGIMGHGFVTTGLLASSFVYYRDSVQWVGDLAKPGKMPIAR